MSLLITLRDNVARTGLQHALLPRDASEAPGMGEFTVNGHHAERGCRLRRSRTVGHCYDELVGLVDGGRGSRLIAYWDDQAHERLAHWLPQLPEVGKHPRCRLLWWYSPYHSRCRSLNSWTGGVITLLTTYRTVV